MDVDEEAVVVTVPPGQGWELATRSAWDTNSKPFSTGAFISEKARSRQAPVSLL
jgi:hypothetical protein